MQGELSALSVVELKEMLKARGLSTAGLKAKLISRLRGIDSSTSETENGESGDVEEYAEDERSAAQGNMSRENLSREDASRREIELYKRERELAERELDLARREILLLRGQLTRAGDSASGATETATLDDGETPYVRPRASLKTVADLLSDFDGTSNNFDTWEKQLRFLKTTYRLEDDCAKLLIGMRLKKKASEWFHSKSEHIEMPFEKLLEELGTMFRHRESRLHLRKQFENRVWKKEETFQEYLHDKTIKGNLVPIEKDELLEYVIEGIPDAAMRDQARIQGFSTIEGLLKAFEKVTLRDRGVASSHRHGGDKNGTDKKKKIPTDAKRCFNCGEREHVSANCPTKALGAKCFECGARGHISAKCPKKNNSAGKAVVASISRALRKRYMQKVTLNGRVITALIDTGSDISIMRASEYAMIGSPRMQMSNTMFCGIGGFSARILGEFRADISIDECTYPI